MNTADLLGSRGLLNSGMAAIADAVNAWARSQEADRRDKRRQDLMLREEARQAKLDQAQESNRRLQILLQHGVDISEPDYLEKVKGLKAAELAKKNEEQALDLEGRKTKRLAELFNLGTQGADVYPDEMSTPSVEQLAQGASLMPLFTPDQRPEARMNRKGLEINKKFGVIAEEKRAIEAQKAQAQIEKLLADAAGGGKGGRGRGSEKQTDVTDRIAKITRDLNLKDETDPTAAQKKIIEHIEKLKKTNMATQEDLDVLQFLKTSADPVAVVGPNANNESGLIGKTVDVVGGVAKGVDRTAAGLQIMQVLKNLGLTAKDSWNDVFDGVNVMSPEAKAAQAARIVEEARLAKNAKDATMVANTVKNAATGAEAPGVASRGFSRIAKIAGGERAVQASLPSLDAMKDSASAVARTAGKTASFGSKVLTGAGRLLTGPAAIITEGALSAADLVKYPITGSTVTGKGEGLGDGLVALNKVANKGFNSEDLDGTVNNWALNKDVSSEQLWANLIGLGKLNAGAKKKEAREIFVDRVEGINKNPKLNFHGRLAALKKLTMYMNGGFESNEENVLIPEEVPNLPGVSNITNPIQKHVVDNFMAQHGLKKEKATSDYHARDLRARTIQFLRNKLGRNPTPAELSREMEFPSGVGE